MRAHATVAAPARSAVPARAEPAQLTPVRGPDAEASPVDYRLGQVPVMPVAPGAIQPKLRIGRPDDAYEAEADRVADQVVSRMMAPGQPAGDGDEDDEEAVGTSAAPEGVVFAKCATCAAEERIAPLGDDTVQRTCAGCGGPVGGSQLPEEESEAGDLAEDEEGSAPEEEGLGVVRAKPQGAPSPGAARGPSRLAAFSAGLHAAEGGGQPLGRDVRTSVGRAFGFDFGKVRIHTDGAAATLASSIRALAFTRGSHIYFSQGAYRPDTREGTRLLAHELTHVLQQSRGAMSGGVQRKPKPRKKTGPAYRAVGEIGIFEANSDTPIERVPLFEVKELKPAVVDAEVDKSTGKITFALPGLTSATPLNARTRSLLIRAAKTGKTFRIRIYAKGSQEGKGGGSGWKLGERKEGDQEADKAQKGEGGTGTRPKGPPGSKYGVFGWLKLPRWAAKALESVLETLDRSGEYLALAETLRALKDLAEHREKLTETFKDTDKLLDVILGLEGNAAFDRLGDWAKTKPPARAKGPGHRDRRGIMKLAHKVAALLAKVRAVLRPIFLARDKFVAVFQGSLALIATLPSVEELFDLGADIANKPRAVLQSVLGKVSKQLGASVEEKLLAARKSVALAKEKFLEGDLIGQKEVAAAVLAAFKKMAKGPYKLIVLASEVTRLDNVLADKLVAPLIPPQALEGVNASIREMGQRLEVVIEPALLDLDRVLTGIAEGLAAELPAQIESAFVQTSRKPDTPSFAPRVGVAERSMRASTGHPLPDRMRDVMEAGIGFRFGDVRIHADRPAAAAADALFANAFTSGRHVFFGERKYDPETREGRRLLAHELTHVAQQSAMPASDLVQGDWMAVRKKVVTKYGVKVKEALKITSGGDPKTFAIAKEAREWVAQHVNKPIFPGTKLPEPYDFVRKGGQISSIRRKFKYMRKVPSLSIDRAKGTTGGGIGLLRLGVLAKLGVYNVLPEMVYDSSAARFPTIAPHIKDSQNKGSPKVLHYAKNEAIHNSNRNAACGKVSCASAQSCDEYPFASSHEGGHKTPTFTKCVPSTEQSRQGQLIKTFNDNYNPKREDKFAYQVKVT